MDIRKFLLLITGVLIILLALGIWFFPTNSDFRVENQYWNGIKDVTSRYNILPIVSFEELASLSNNTTLIVIPYLNFSTIELEQLRSYICCGGNLILADDFGDGNQILKYLGLKPRFNGNILLDPLVNYKNSQFPRITRLNRDILTVNTDNLVFNHATSLSGVADTELIASSSPFSFLDSNTNGTHDDSETAGPVPVISRHPLGYGQVVLISDPSIFINGMDDIAGNAAFIQNIADSAGGLYIDQSHLIQSELHQARNWLQKARTFATSAAGTSGLVIIGIMVSLIPVWHKKKDKTG